MTSIAYDFTGRDYTARFEALLTQLVADVPELSDLNHSDAGISLLRLLARESDMLAFYIDEVFREGYIPTARFRQSVLDLIKLVDWPATLASPAATTITVTRKTGVTEAISIPAWSIFTRLDGLEFITTEAVTILEGESSVDIPVIQGERTTTTLTSADMITIDASGELKYNLGQGVVSGYVEVSHSGGTIVWSQEESFWRSKSTDYHFRLELYADEYNGLTDTVFLIMGDGTFSAAPPATFSLSFVTTLGAEGNTGAGTIVVAPSSLSDYVDVTNSVSATGGAAVELTESIKERVPRITRTQRRMVTKSDYEDMIEGIAGVADCQCVDRNDEEPWPHLYVKIYVVPMGGGAMSGALTEEIYMLCETWGHLGTWRGRYLLSDPTEVPVDVTCRIGLTSGSNQSTVTTAVGEAISGLFDVPGIDIGDYLSFSDLHAAVSAVSGVSWVEFTSPSNSVTTTYGHILTLGTVSITVV